MPQYGNWKEVRELGSGSYGTVYEIEQTDELGFTTRSALKVIRIPRSEVQMDELRGKGESEEAVAEYFREMAVGVSNEIRMMYRLKGHTNIVGYEDHQIRLCEDGISWELLIRMELLTPLNKYVVGREITRKTVIKLGIDICNALERCQKFNIIHRDIKPGNILVSESGDFKLSDFGIARRVAEDATMAALSQKGTFTYMAPEVYLGRAYGFSVDLYSLGIVMYQLLNYNRDPFLPPYPERIHHGDYERAMARRMKGEEFLYPAHDSGQLAEIVLKACSYDPANRYSSPRQMREDLESVQYSETDWEQVVGSSPDILTIPGSERSASSSLSSVPAPTEREGNGNSRAQERHEAEDPPPKEPTIDLHGLLSGSVEQEPADGTESLPEDQNPPTVRLFRDAAENDSPAPAEEEASEAAPVEEDIGEAAPAEEDASEAAPAEEDIGEAAPAEEDIGEAAPVEEDIGEAAPAEEDIGEAAPAEEDASEATPAEEDINEAAPAEEDISEAAPAEEDNDGAAASRPGTENRNKIVRIVAVVLVVLLGVVGCGGGYYLATTSEVPDVSLLTEQEAVELLEAASLTAESEEWVHSDDVDRGCVVSVSNVGERVAKNSGVTLTLSLGSVVTVPDEVGAEGEQAISALEQLGLTVSTDSDYSDEYTEGLVIAQSLEAESDVDEGTEIVLTLSEGPKPFALESYKGQTLEDAQAALEALGLTVEVKKSYSTEIAKGSVIKQSPEAGEQVRKGDTVTLNVSKGPEQVEVPDVTGMTVEEATAALEAVGLTLGETTSVYSSYTSEGYITEQGTAAGTEADKGSSVSVKVSKGPQPSSGSSSKNSKNNGSSNSNSSSNNSGSSSNSSSNNSGSSSSSSSSSSGDNSSDISNWTQIN